MIDSDQVRFSLLINMICVWRKVRNGDRTALRAIPVCAPLPICVEGGHSLRS